MKKQTKIQSTTEAWETGKLGENLASARIAPPELSAEIDASLGMQMISIRLPKSVIEDFKVMAQIEGIGYQPLMRTALIRFAECEAKRVMRDYAAVLANEKRHVVEHETQSYVDERKAA